MLGYLRNYKRESVLAPLFKMLEATFDLFVPLVMADIVNVGIAAHDLHYILVRCGILLVLAVIGLTCSLTAQYFSAKAAVGYSTALRHALFAHIQSLSFSEMDTLGTSTLITRMTSDINQVQTGVNMCLRLLLRSPFVVFGAMIMAFTIDTRCAMIFAGVIVALCIIVFSIMLITIPMYRHVQGQLDSVTATTRENLTGVRVIRAFCKEDAENEKFERKIQLLTRMQLRVGRISAMMNPATYVVINAAVIVLIHTGAVRVQMGALSQGQVVALYNYMSQILVELIKMANLIITLTKAAACGDRVASVLSVKSTQKDGEKTPALDAPHGSVVFDGVSMRYAGAGTESVSGVSFTAAPGSTVGIIGGTGSGKSTMMYLLQRLYTAPLTAGDFIFGYVLPLAPMAAVQAAVCYLAAIPLGLTVSVRMIWAVLLDLPAALLFIGLGLLCGSVMNVKQVGGICGALLTNLTAWLSGTWFDLELVGGAFQRIAYALPFVHAVELDRAALSGDWASVMPHLWWVLAYAAAALAAAVLLFLRQMKRQ